MNTANLPLEQTSWHVAVGHGHFAANEESKTITILVSGDMSVEADEGFLVTLSNPSSVLVSARRRPRARSSTTTPSLSISSINAHRAEGHSGNTGFTFAISRAETPQEQPPSSFRSQEVRECRRYDGFRWLFPAGSISFAANETTKIITLNSVATPRLRTTKGSRSRFKPDRQRRARYDNSQRYHRERRRNPVDCGDECCPL